MERPTQTQEGWKPDPIDEGQERWWDGESWTGATRQVVDDAGTPNPAASQPNESMSSSAQAGAEQETQQQAYLPSPTGELNSRAPQLKARVVPGMHMIQAVQSAFELTFNWKGRASRSAYWLFQLVWAIVIVGPLVVAVVLPSEVFVAWLALIAILFVAFFVVSISLTVRRLHDTGGSGWWFWISLVPFGGLVLLYFTLLPSYDGRNDYGPEPEGGVTIVS